ncbi:MAG TPA: PAS domain S-box protein [Syntrophales bacterium]|nr:PAS domain S-box protein [Syntrophales bacterium]HOX94036.1 PAS domain S-box protein [Syntrophales bacterium]HPI58319.1 PAS domain S-box protein [Syntrophales bacterium]HPN26137.1 PAS domain S-box protein [Syntrophales bacterium]HQM30514.1 PAS domain S-box protein [Syntrophales bacterium]
MKSETSPETEIAGMPARGNGSGPPAFQFMPDGTITYRSESFCRLVEGMVEDLARENVFDMIPEPEHAGLRGSLETLTPEHSMSFHELGVFTPGGDLRRQMWAIRAFFNGRGNPSHYEAACIDVTERKNNEGLYRTLAEKSMAGVYVVQGGKFTYLNRNAAAYARYEAGELVGTHAMALVLPEDREKVRENSSRMLQRLSSSPYEFRIRTKDGGVRWIMETVTAITLEGRPAVLGNSMDVTEIKRATEEIERIQRQQKALLDSIPDIAWMKDAQDRFIAVNEAFGRFCGKETGDVIGRSDSDIFPPDTAQRFHSDDQAVRKARQRQTVEKAIVTERGETTWLETVKTPILNDGNEVIGTAGIARDITERRKSEQVLRDSEARFRLLAENVSDVILLINLDGRSTYVSPSIEQLLGYTPEEALSLKYRDAMKPQSLQAVMEFFRNDIPKGDAEQISCSESRVHELELVHKDGAVRWTELKFKLLRAEDGTPENVLGVLRDIHERKLAEMALRKSEDMFRLLAENIKDVILLTGLDGRVLYVSPSVEQMIGYPLDELREKKYRDVMTPRTLLAVKAFLKEKIWNGKAAHLDPLKPDVMELEAVCRDGSVKDVEVRFSVFLNDGGEPHRIIGVMRDISKRKAAERALRESEERLRTYIDSMQDFVFLKDEQSRYLMVNRAFEKYSSMWERDVVGKTDADCYPPDSAGPYMESDRKVLESRTMLTGEARLGDRCFEWWKFPVSLGNGRTGVGGFIHDITERKKIEEALRESEARFRALADGTPVGVLIHQNGIIQYAGQTAGRMMGYQNQAEFLGHSVMEYLHEEDRARVADITRRRIAGEDAPSQYEARLVRKDGSVIDALISAMTIEYGGQRCTQAAFMDITEHKKAAETLRQNEAKLQGILRVAPIGISLLYHDTPNWVSEGMCLMTGYSPEELKGTTREFLYCDRKESRRVRSGMLKQLHRKGVASAETKWKTKDGRVIDVFLRAAVLPGGRMPQAELVLTVMDITEIKETEAALRDSRQRMSDIINFLPDATCVIDRQGTVIAWNHALERLSGIKAKDIIGKGDYEYALPFAGRRKPVLIDMAMNPGELIKKSCVDVDKKGDVLSGVLQAADTSGKKRHLHTIAAPFRDAAGNVTGAIACLRDVTEQKKSEQFLQGITKDLRQKARKRARDLNVANTLLRVELEEHRKTEEALRESEQRYRAIVEDQNELICRFGTDLKITFVNEAFCRYGGRSFEDLLGCSFSSLFDREEWGRIENILSIFDRENACRTVECRSFIPDGGTRWQQWTLRAVYGDKGRFIEYQAVGRDSTEQKAFEMRLQESRNMLRSVFDGIADPLMMIGRDLQVRMLNRAAIKYYDIRDYKDVLGGEARGRLFVQFGPEDAARIFQGIRDKKALNFELTTEGKPQRNETVSIYPVRGESRKDDAAIVRISDRTKEKILERQSRQSEKLASLGLLVSGLVHEINNPNNFIIFNMPILRDYVKELLPVIDAHARSQGQYELFQMPYEEFRNDLLTLLKNIEHGAQRINNTIGILSEFTCKRENGERCLTNLSEIIEKAVAICQPQIKSHVRHFHVELPPDLPHMFTDPDSLEQVLINLLINAVHACDKEDSRVTLTVSKGKTWQNRFLIEVTDNGCGMDADTTKKIFEPFFTTKPQGLGTGLGLYISCNQIERLGGQLEVESRPGEGSTFRVTLPDPDLKADIKLH